MQWDYRNADAGNEAERELLLDMVRATPPTAQGKWINVACNPESPQV